MSMGLYSEGWTINRFKTRLVAKGYKQIFGLNYCDIFSIVPKISSVYLFLARVVIHHCLFDQLDIKISFLHVELEKEFIWINLQVVLFLAILNLFVSLVVLFMGLNSPHMLSLVASDMP